ncbi:MAG: hypothetical protein FWG61_07240 [Firmicutes bacterium]|nr:hypothetical protein [Bacillota bacterium]
MKKQLLCSALIITTLLYLTACHNTMPAAEFVGDVAIKWVEPALEALVRQELGKPQGIIYREELDHIKYIELYGESHLFFNLEGGYFTLKEGKDINVHVSDGRGNMYKDGTYEIEGIEYNRGSIASLADFANFRNLNGLYIFKNDLTDLSGLSALANLEDISLWDCAFKDVRALASLKQLKLLSLDYNNIEDMSALSGFDQVVMLSVAGNCLSSLEWLSGFNNVLNLTLNYNPLTSLEGLRQLASFDHLETLNLIGTQIDDVSVLAGSTSLRTLQMKYQKVNSLDVAQLALIVNLEILTLEQTQAKLENFRSLNELYFLQELRITPNINVPDEDIEWLRDQLDFCNIE